MMIFDHDRASVAHADARAFLQTLPENSIDSCVTDPPYELGFMGKAWDSTGIAFDPAFWREVLRVLKPGAHLCAFGGTRTFHRIAVAIEDAGFEIRDHLIWLYGTGFPKSLNLGDGIGTALKPAYEPITLARKPVDESTIAANLAAWGTGGLNIDACRLGRDPIDPSREGEQPRTNGVTSFRPQGGARGGAVAGRWPANVILDEEAGAMLDAQSGLLKSGNVTKTYEPIDENLNSLGKKKRTLDPSKVFADSGGASRFFYSAKTSRAERDLGCEHLTPKSGGEATDREDDSAGTKNPRAGAGRAGGVRNFHPTVKPVSLMRWLVRLVTPQGGIVLDPFVGSGSTGIAALVEGRSFLGSEMTGDYAPIISGRLNAALAGRFNED